MPRSNRYKENATNVLNELNSTLEKFDMYNTNYVNIDTLELEDEKSDDNVDLGQISSCYECDFYDHVELGSYNTSDRLDEIMKLVDEEDLQDYQDNNYRSDIYDYLNSYYKENDDGELFELLREIIDEAVSDEAYEHAHDFGYAGWSNTSPVDCFMQYNKLFKGNAIREKFENLAIHNQFKTVLEDEEFFDDLLNDTQDHNLGSYNTSYLVYELLIAYVNNEQFKNITVLENIAEYVNRVEIYMEEELLEAIELKKSTLLADKLELSLAIKQENKKLVKI